MLLILLSVVQFCHIVDEQLNMSDNTNLSKRHCKISDTHSTYCLPNLLPQPQCESTFK